jgi:PBP1b-binding outer membrane lipoprotein LpoB
MKKLISILLAVILIAAMFAGCKGKKATVSDYSGMENVQAMIEYAQMLEEQGNKEAAAQVWAMIPDAADESAREDCAMKPRAATKCRRLKVWAMQTASSTH